MKAISNILISALFFFISSSSFAEEVTLPFNNLTLNANLEIAEGKTISDGVVLIMHSFLAHNRMEIIKASQDAFLENEQNSLAINLSLGVDNRHGNYDCFIPIRFKLSDAIAELDIWINWLSRKGVEKIVLMGHSISSNQILNYMAKRNNPSVTGLVLLAPNTRGTASSPARYKETYGTLLSEVLERAKLLIADGKKDQLMKEVDWGFCPKTSVSADAFVAFYKRKKEFWNAHLYLPQINVPVLIVAASHDEHQPNIDKYMKPYVDDKRIFLTIVEGAGHFFRDLNIEDAVEAAVEFVDNLETTSS
ncbi:alpha/beta hydrolase [uncultured Cocleimonas sp.]|uniref:alpha/beta hydrolase n=1 Tax=uncultured Cocleimonas sp. TaxID=1051587 RepID=UPI0026223B82|nr:alpha/beta hydrolase [uncultured Cocleimonas sp.]